MHVPWVLRGGGAAGAIRHSGRSRGLLLLSCRGPGGCLWDAPGVRDGPSAGLKFLRPNWFLLLSEAMGSSDAAKVGWGSIPRKCAELGVDVTNWAGTKNMVASSERVKKPRSQTEKRTELPNALTIMDWRGLKTMFLQQ